MALGRDAQWRLARQGVSLCFVLALVGAEAAGQERAGLATSGSTAAADPSGLEVLDEGLSASAPAQSPQREVEAIDLAVALDRATLDYESGHYGQCVRAFRRLIQSAPESQEPNSLRSQMTTYLAACLVASGQPDDAREEFRQAILANRHMAPPDPIVFPRAVVDLFVEVRSRLMAALQKQQEDELALSRARIESRRQAEERERARVAELERQVQRETVVRLNERWMAWVPFGVGQFHNGDDTLGWLLLGTQSALAVTALTATSLELGLHSRAEGGRSNLDAADLTQTIYQVHTIGTVSWLGLLGLAVAGVAEANYSFRAEVPLGTRPRTTVAPVMSGSYLGVKGTF